VQNAAALQGGRYKDKDRTLKGEGCGTLKRERRPAEKQEGPGEPGPYKVASCD
jgi:hypothetical protein